MKTFLKSLALVLALTTGAIAAPINQGPIYIYQPLGGSSGGGGTGCVPAGAASNILTDTGAGACGSDNSAQLLSGALSLGASGTLGSITMGNATTGLLTLEPAAGALGTVTLLLPAINDTLTALTATQTLTNKTIDGGSNTLTNLNASNLSSGTVAAARGGAGTVNGILKANGSGTVSQAIAATDYAPATTGATLLIGSSGGFANYAGVTCTNQFLRSLSAAGAGTCQSVAIASDVSGLATGIATFLGAPSSANLATALTDETGTGSVVFSASPTFSGTIGGTPNWGAGLSISAAQTYKINGVQITCSALSNASASCSTDATNAANISSGSLPVARLPAPTTCTATLRFGGASTGITATTTCNVIRDNQGQRIAVDMLVTNLGSATGNASIIFTGITNTLTGGGAQSCYINATGMASAGTTGVIYGNFVANTAILVLGQTIPTTQVSGSITQTAFTTSTELQISCNLITN